MNPSQDQIWDDFKHRTHHRATITESNSASSSPSHVLRSNQSIHRLQRRMTLSYSLLVVTRRRYPSPQTEAPNQLARLLVPNGRTPHQVGTPPPTSPIGVGTQGTRHRRALPSGEETSQAKDEQGRKQPASARVHSSVPFYVRKQAWPRQDKQIPQPRLDTSEKSIR